MEEDLEKTTLLIHAVRQEDEDLVKLLVEHKALPNGTDSKGLTTLMHAVRANDTEMVDHLFKLCPPQASTTQKGDLPSINVFHTLYLLADVDCFFFVFFMAIRQG